MGEQDNFQDRLSRISDERTRMKDAKGGKEKPKRAAAGLPDYRDSLRYPLSIIWAFVVGLIAVFAARYIRYHLTGGSLSGGDSADITMIIDAGIAGATGFALKGLLSLESKTLQLAQNIGVAVMVVMMHNLVHIAPAPFSWMFSPEWVRDVEQTTEPKSILFRGVTFLLSSDPPPMISEDGTEAVAPNDFTRRP